jgi:hypothetical protein
MAPRDEDTQNGSPEQAIERKNKNHLIVAAVMFVCALALIIGLSVGLTNDDNSNSSSANNNGPGPDGSRNPTASPTATVMMMFNRVASFPICMQLDANCNTDEETVSEILYASDDGNTVIYTDSAKEQIGFIDITDPASPQPLGIVAVGGDPTSVAVLGEYALVAVNTSPDFVNPSGTLQVVNIATQTVVRTMEIGGQPDSIAVSPDKQYAAIAIENERDEDFNDGLLPQLPAGYLTIVDTSSADPQDWSLATVDLTGLDGVLYSSDPEPEYVSINKNNICVLTLQENNALVLIDLETATVIKSFSAGFVDIDGVDTVEDNLITQTQSLTAIPREPDAVAWIGTEYFATADEGDLDGGSRSFTIWDPEGNIVYTSGNEMDRWAARVGHYPDERSENKGAEPETVAYAEYGQQKLLFVSLERASLVFVYNVEIPASPVLHQILPTGVAPEGVFAIPSRNLLVTASEGDSRADKFRAQVSIYHLSNEAAIYPTIISADRDDGSPIPFSALSGLSASGNMVYTVEDSFYVMSRVLAIDTSEYPYTVTEEMRVTDGSGLLAAAVATESATILINDDGTVNLDLEGIEAVDGGFWVVSEGSGTIGDDARPFETPNLLLFLDESAVITQVVPLSDEIASLQVRFGFEGVAVDGDNVLVAFQRAWNGEDHPRLGLYNNADSTWTFLFYELEPVQSQYGGWVGLSDLESLGNGVFLVLERDNQAGPDASIKRIYRIDLGDYSFADGSTISRLDKILVRDLIPDFAAYGGLVPEKIEGLTVGSDGSVWVNNDNDGVDDNTGEQLLINVGAILADIDVEERIRNFNRVASFPICMQLDANCNTDEETVSEILYASDDGNTVIYTDSAKEQIGFIDITDPASPQPLGIVAVGGDPTSVAVLGEYALVAVNTSPDFVNPSGTLQVVNIATQTVVRTMEIGGQPDSIAVSPDKQYAAIAIENERDEDFNDGLLPQLPAGYLTIVDTSSADPQDWSLATVDLTGLDGVLYSSDPEPEYVSINKNNICVLTLQENNALVLIDLETATVIKSFSAGFVDIDGVDTVEDNLITQTQSLTAIPREPDAVAWIGTEYFATADEGDLDGGSRSFTIWDPEGNIVYTSGNEMDRWAARVGHYPDERSENKGAEPETVAYAEYGQQKLLFVSLERASLVFVYNVEIPASPVLHQILPTGVAPEGVFAIPSRNLLVTASEGDSRADKFRAQVSIYHLSNEAAIYPTIISADRDDGSPIPFSALSGLAAEKVVDDQLLYTVEDSFYVQSRMLVIDTSVAPSVVISETRLLDANGLLTAAFPSLTFVNDDGTVNLDLEGIELAESGGFWVVNEGSGTVGDAASPFETPNLLLKLDDVGVITEVIELPEAVASLQVGFGFQGVAEEGDFVVVAFQRAWTGEDHPRLGIYNSVAGTWNFVFYQLDAPASQFGGWVGLSDLAALGGGSFLVLEGDNQGGPDAAIKRVYRIELGDYSFTGGTLISDKTLVRDLIPDLQAPGGLVPEKIEGLAVTVFGDVWINNDNDGVDDNNGEQLLINLGTIV